MEKSIKTLAELKASGYTTRSVKDETRENLINKIQKKEVRFPGIVGFDQTVLPDVERAILSRHHILLLGLRGQAKTAIARLMTNLLDEWMPIIKGNELNDDPLHPITRYGKDLVAEMGDQTPIDWIHRSERYVEKLATPDVSIADLIGDVDPIKAATLKLPYSDERVIHYGLIPRAHRSIFVINELPDLQARIQVSLFNILQEGDIQIRGFKLRLPLDIQFIFTANPEDYTNRGSIITPLKDRIESQVLTHYPESIEDAKRITRQEAKLSKDQEKIKIPELLHELLEQIAFVARDSELIDEKSGVSARLSISAFENLISTAERRMLINGESETTVRLSDFWGIIPSITGKVELVYEGEQEGPYAVALKLMGDAIKELFLRHLPNPEKSLRKNDVDLFEDIRNWFSRGNSLEIYLDEKDETYLQKLDKVPGLRALAKKISGHPEELQSSQELILFALSEFNILTKELVDTKMSFGDMLANMLDELDN
ncbi:MAG: sigma 54-interacting transcriptional regulator [Saprospiraceae bacterium]|nr:sigma 54-interacting transcriptional regulator [Saprospiraceae bacterium]